MPESSSLDDLCKAAVTAVNAANEAILNHLRARARELTTAYALQLILITEDGTPWFEVATLLDAEGTPIHPDLDDGVWEVWEELSEIASDLWPVCDLSGVFRLTVELYPDQLKEGIT